MNSMYEFTEGQQVVVSDSNWNGFYQLTGVIVSFHKDAAHIALVRSSQGYLLGYYDTSYLTPVIK